MCKKRIVLVMVLTMLLVVPSMANRVSPGMAFQAGQVFLNAKGWKSALLNDISSEIGLDNLYVLASDHAFVVLAADDRVAPVLGYSLNQGFPVENIPDNVRWWLQGYQDQIQSIIDHQVEPSVEITRQWADLIQGTLQPQGNRAQVAPLIQTTWNQNYPYNYSCPVDAGGPGGHVYAGCVANGMAQIMKYYNYPAHGVGSHSYTHSTYGIQSVNFGASYYNFSTLPLSITSSSNQSDINAISSLMYHCGVAVDMSYGPTVSAASVYKIAPAFINYFGYSQTAAYVARADYSDGEWINLMHAELNASRPVLYGGYSDAQTVGHRFICDGYDTDTYGSFYFHFNWGWSGNHDGYFSIDNMTPTTNTNFSFFQNAIVGIQPSTNTAVPTNLTYGVNNNVITLNWTAAGGASSYQVYKDSEPIGTATTNTYAVNNGYGTHSYYVRSMDTNGELSLSSNAVTVEVAYSAPLVNDLQASVSGNDVSLSWTAPDWCYPMLPSAILNYGQGNVYYSWSAVYYGQRYPASDLSQYAGQSVYKVETYIQYAGDYTVYVYTDSWNGQPNANSLAGSVSRHILNAGWHEFIFDQPVVLSGSKDLWTLIQVENTGQTYPAPSFDLNTFNADACYVGDYPYALFSITNRNISWLMKTCITDGIYTYDLYRNGTSIATNLTGTTYSDNDLEEGSYSYVLKTNYYAGQTDPSNTVEVLISEDGVDEDGNVHLAIHPNPVADQLVVESLYDIRYCEVYSITGQCVVVMKDCSRMFEIDTQSLTPGSYLIRLASDHFVEVRKFVKKN